MSSKSSSSSSSSTSPASPTHTPPRVSLFEAAIEAIDTTQAMLEEIQASESALAEWNSPAEREARAASAQRAMEAHEQREEELFKQLEMRELRAKRMNMEYLEVHILDDAAHTKANRFPASATSYHQPAEIQVELSSLLQSARHIKYVSLFDDTSVDWRPNALSSSSLPPQPPHPPQPPQSSPFPSTTYIFFHKSDDDMKTVLALPIDARHVRLASQPSLFGQSIEKGELTTLNDIEPVAVVRSPARVWHLKLAVTLDATISPSFDITVTESPHYSSRYAKVFLRSWERDGHYRVISCLPDDYVVGAQYLGERLQDFIGESASNLTNIYQKYQWNSICMPHDLSSHIVRLHRRAEHDLHLPVQQKVDELVIDWIVEDLLKQGKLIDLLDRLLRDHETNGAVCFVSHREHIERLRVVPSLIAIPAYEFCIAGLFPIIEASCRSVLHQLTKESPQFKKNGEVKYASFPAIVERLQKVFQDPTILPINTWQRYKQWIGDNLTEMMDILEQHAVGFWKERNPTLHFFTSKAELKDVCKLIHILLALVWITKHINEHRLRQSSTN